MKTIEEQLRDLAVEELGVTPDEVTTEARFKEDLHADSLDRINLTMRVEETLHLGIPDADAESLETFGQLVEYVSARVNATT